LCWAELGGARLSAFEAAASPKGYGSGIFARICWARIGRIFDLAGGDIDNELSELVWIARAGFS
jgi:hypothetical protein